MFTKSLKMPSSFLPHACSQDSTFYNRGYFPFSLNEGHFQLRPWKCRTFEWEQKWTSPRKDASHGCMQQYRKPTTSNI
jgi:hypothetical protein